MTLSLMLLAALFIVAGVAHFVFPAAYASIVPPWLPAPRDLVLLSGFLEVAGGVGVILPATRAAAGWGLILLLVAVFPANVQMLRSAHAAQAPLALQVALIARLPLQPLLIWWVYQSAVRSAP